MESDITIKATTDEMNKFFDENSVCLVKYFESKGNGTFKVKVRHAELDKELSGTYTIPRLIAKLQKIEG